VEDPAELPDEGQLLLGQQELLLAGARGLDVDGREDPLLGSPAIEPELPVPRSLELLALYPPKNRFGGYSAVESTPPERIRPDAGVARL
jgi:hypothetical protein